MKEAYRAAQCARVMYEADRASQGLGIAVEVNEAGGSEARMQVTAAMINGFDVCHGGYIFLLADTAFAFACNGYDNLTVAASAEIDFLRPARLGDTLRATAAERHKGSKTGLYDIEVRNQEGKTVAIFRGRSHSTGRPLLDSK